MDTKNGRPTKGRREIPKADLECVWVKAGLIASKVCDLDFDCENCPLDAALRLGFRGPREENEAVIPAPGVDASLAGSSRTEVKERILDNFFHQLEQFYLPDDRYYFRAHTWVQDGGRRTVAIGIDDLAAKVLPHANSVVFPSSHSYVRQGEYCSWLVGSEGTIAFVSPVTGRIATVNEELYGMPDLVRTSPYEKGWLAKIELENLQLDMRKLLPRISANARYRKDIERIRRRLYVHTGTDMPTAGATLLDGGRYVENVQSLLGLRRYVELVSVLFRP
jgi:glycine cleavage system H protein